MIRRVVRERMIRKERRERTWLMDIWATVYFGIWVEVNWERVDMMMRNMKPKPMMKKTF